MRRRRQKNTLLPKMIGLAVLINAILLPILAQMGVFKNIGGQKLTQVELVKLPPPEKRPPQPKKTAKKQAAKPHPAGHKAASRPTMARRAPSGPPPIKVVAAGPTPGGAAGTGDAEITASDRNTSPTPAPATSASPAPPPPSMLPPPAPTQPPPTPKPSPTPLSPVPVVTAAILLSQPQPSIPDDLRDNDLNTAFEALFTIHADGTAGVKTISSTGNPTLDSLALDAARRWTFRPATRDGQPVQSYLRLRIEFTVSS